MPGSLPTEADIKDIQGNILGGFKQDAQTFLFFTLPSSANARRWLAAIVDDVASSAHVLDNNRKFKQAVKSDALFKPKARFLNVAFTAPGLAALGIPSAELEGLPEDFRQGMRARAQRIGDVDGSAPAKWVGRFAQDEPHVMLLLAADDEHELHALAFHHIQLALVHGVHLMHLQPGHTRGGAAAGHEHFGFKDGISQPGIRGLDTPDDPKNPDQGQPGQDLLWPGEFVIGYSTQDPSDAKNPGQISQAGPAWTRNGSFLVYRRLQQDVRGFREFVAQAAKETGESKELTGARLVGRYESGAPLEKLEEPDAFPNPLDGDPSLAAPSILDRAHVNDFEYGADPEGKFVPLAAHIRKAYPRDQAVPGEAQTQTRRLLRRGIPYGASFRPGELVAPPFPFDRGLNFLAYQSSIERQFEFVQQSWVNNPNFPAPGAGHDPIIAQQDAKRTFSLTTKNGKAAHLTLMKRWVTTTAGAYFFSPAISVLRSWK